ncbi:MAG TPA: tripartite tricarboxylate transporter substrate binding protein [Candidatus Binatia bacterium]|jgi:tripartite-type tricarboxylate transporter receptor subunit TctC|nr:tripartite tricarboxylate transporter substrate binding protein [Candidatus Binatia bacterium]
MSEKLKSSKIKASLSLLLLTLLTVTSTFAQEPFYKGKSVRIIVGLSAGGGYDRAARIVARHMPKYIPGNPEIIVQNMPGAGSVIAANYVYTVAKPDGLTLVMPHNNFYLNQLSGDKEVRYDLGKFQWIGNLERDDMMLFGRADAPFKSVADIIKAKELPKCGSTGIGSSDYVMSKILEETVGAKVQHVTGYPGSSEIAIALERGEVQCMGLTIGTYFSREPFLTWLKSGFTRFLAQSGKKRDPRVNGPTIYELMDEYKTSPAKRRVAQAMLAGGDWARPMLAPPGTPPDRVKILREAYQKAAADPELLADAKKGRIEVEAGKGEDLQALAKEVMNQPPEVVEQVKKLFVVQ